MSLVSDRVIELCTSQASVLSEMQLNPHAEPGKIAEKLLRLRKRDKLRDSVSLGKSSSSLSVHGRHRSTSSLSNLPMTSTSALPSATSPWRSLEPVKGTRDDHLLSPERLPPNSTLHTSQSSHSPLNTPASTSGYSTPSSAYASPVIAHSVSSPIIAHPMSAHSRTISNGSSIYSRASSSKTSILSKSSSVNAHHTTPITAQDLDRAALCGRFLTRPSDLFLKILVGVLRAIDKDPMVNLVSPSLTAATGVIPLSIISVIPDIIRHYADVILSAEREIFLATNFWENSQSSRVITDALRELSKKAGMKKRRIVVKIMYDRGNIKQLLEPHQVVPPKEYTTNAVNIPAPEEVPNLDLEVINYHRPALGTFHGKFLVVDRKIALINSNNIQDRCNLEMCSTLEGDIVDSFLDMALITWNNALNPPLPSLGDVPIERRSGFQFGEANPHILAKEDLKSAKDFALQNLVNSKDKRKVRRGPLRSLLWPEGGTLPAITARLNTTLQPDTKGTFVQSKDSDMEDFQPHIVHPPHEPFPICMVNRKPRGSLNYTKINNPQAAAWLGGFRHAQRSVFVQTPTFNAPPVVDAALAAVKRGVKVTLFLDLGFNDAAERLPKQGGTNETVVQRMFSQLDKQEKINLEVFWYTGKDMSRPINAARKQRNCHIKLMVVDDQVGIHGNGNQDSQSWFHSQESNIMCDSEIICKDWLDAIYSNQNTHLYGKVDDDGIWRDPKDGSLLESSGLQGGFAGSLKGLSDTIRRATGNK